MFFGGSWSKSSETVVIPDQDATTLSMFAASLGACQQCLTALHYGDPYIKSQKMQTSTFF